MPTCFCRPSVSGFPKSEPILLRVQGAEELQYKGSLLQILSRAFIRQRHQSRQWCHRHSTAEIAGYLSFRNHIKTQETCARMRMSVSCLQVSPLAILRVNPNLFIYFLLSGDHKSHVPAPLLYSTDLVNQLQTHLGPLVVCQLVRMLAEGRPLVEKR